MLSKRGLERKTVSYTGKALRPAHEGSGEHLGSPGWGTKRIHSGSVSLPWLPLGNPLEGGRVDGKTSEDGPSAARMRDHDGIPQTCSG